MCTTTHILFVYTWWDLSLFLVSWVGCSSGVRKGVSTARVASRSTRIVGLKWVPNEKHKPPPPTNNNWESLMVQAACLVKKPLDGEERLRDDPAARDHSNEQRSSTYTRVYCSTSSPLEPPHTTICELPKDRSFFLSSVKYACTPFRKTTTKKTTKKQTSKQTTNKQQTTKETHAPHTLHTHYTHTHTHKHQMLFMHTMHEKNQG